MKWRPGMPVSACSTHLQGKLSDLDWLLSSSSTYGSNCNRVPATHDHRVVKVVDCRADVARDQEQQFSDRGDFGAVCHAHGQVLFTRRERLEARMSKHHAGRD